MARSTLIAALGLASLVAASAAQAETFNLGIGGNGSMTTDSNGYAVWQSAVTTDPSLTISGEYKANCDWVQANVNQDEYGLGIQIPADTDPNVDNKPFERLVLSFKPDAQLSSLTFTFAGFVDWVSMYIPDMKTDDGVQIPLSSGYVFTEGNCTSVFTYTMTPEDSLYNLGNATFLISAQAKTPNPTSFRLLSIEATAVPLPAAVWGGMALMGMMGVGRLRKQLRAA